MPPIIRPGDRRRGELHYLAKLSNAGVRAIRDAYGAGATVSDLAREYGVSRRCIRLVLDGRTWRHVA